MTLPLCLAGDALDRVLFEATCSDVMPRPLFDRRLPQHLSISMNIAISPQHRMAGMAGMSSPPAFSLGGRLGPEVWRAVPVSHQTTETRRAAGRGPAATRMLLCLVRQ